MKRVVTVACCDMEKGGIFSTLDEDLIEHILDFLSTKDIARANVLSKAFHKAVGSHPVLDIDQHNYPSTKSFVNYVKKRLLRLSAQKILLRILKLRITNHDFSGSDDLITSLISITGNGRLEELNFSCLTRNPCNLPRFSSSTLTSLSLFGFKLENTGDLGFPSLQTLNLDNIIVDSDVVKSLIARSPLLENLRLSSVSDGLTSLVVSGHPRVRTITARSCRKLVMFEIRAPRLESFTYRAGLWEECQIKLEGCEESLKTLAIEHANVSKEWLESQVSKFVALRSLSLSGHETLDTIRFSSPSLTELAVIDCTNLDENTIIDAPNLLEIEYCDNMLPFYSLPASNKLLKAKFNSKIEDINEYTRTIWFQKLEESFAKINHPEDPSLVFLFHDAEILIIHDELGDPLIDVIKNLHHLDLMPEITICSSVAEESIKHYISPPNTCESMYLVLSSSSQSPQAEERVYKMCKELCIRKEKEVKGWDEINGDTRLKEGLSNAYKDMSFILIRLVLEE